MNIERGANIEMGKREYSDLVDYRTPKYSTVLRVGKAFIAGGLLCAGGQGITNLCTGVWHLDEATASTICSMTLIFFSVVLTVFHLFARMAAWAGAGVTVPITGFANSIASCAMEYKSEGWIFGVGCKIFTIAGPVILYGVFTSWLAGIVLWIIGLWR